MHAQERREEVLHFKLRSCMHADGHKLRLLSLSMFLRYGSADDRDLDAWAPTLPVMMRAVRDIDLTHSPLLQFLPRPRNG